MTNIRLMTNNKTYRLLHYLLYAVFVMMAAVGMGGCSDDDGDTPAVIANDVIVSFRVVTESQPQTRGVTPTPNDVVWGGEYDKEKGDVFDNTLLVEGFSVFVTNEECTQRYAEVKGLIGIRSEETVNGVTTVIYNFVGEISAADAQTLISKKTGKLHVVANMPNFSSDDMLNGKQPSFTLSGQPGGNFKAIPMWGVTTVTNFADMATMVNPNDQFDAGEVWLLRSMAKVEIVVDESVRGSLTLTSATMNNLNPAGYLLPSNHTTISNTRILEISKTLNPNTPIRKQSANFGPTQDGCIIVFYLPEIEVTNENRPSIDLSYNFAGIEGSKTIQFGQYINGTFDGSTYFNIVRNHLYRFTVKRNEIMYTICPMGHENIDIPPFN